MGADFPTLAEHLSSHRRCFRPDSVGGGAYCACFSWSGDRDLESWNEHAATTWREACTIRTVEQLDALPEQSVVRNMAFGVVFECEVENDGLVIWAAPGGLRVTTVMLPASLIWHPDWATA